MKSYRIKSYFLKKTKLNGKKAYVIYAKVFKYRFGFLVDFWDERLDSNFLAEHQRGRSIRLAMLRSCLQHPMKRKVAYAKLEILTKHQ